MVGIVNYGAGNIFSLCSSLNRLHIPFDKILNPVDFERFTHIIIPGVGHAGSAMNKLKTSGLATYIAGIQKPVLGICVGMQLLTRHSEEGDSNLLNIIPLHTKRFLAKKGIKVPHMGWNKVNHDNNPLFNNIPAHTQFYFVHSYFIEYNPIFDLATATHGSLFSAAIHKDNFYGVQFHPEKSGAAGEQLLKNFIQI